MSDRCNGSNNATAKRKRGRPPGLKIKPTFPVGNNMPHAATLHPHILEIPAGGDVAETIVAFARGCRIFSVCVLTASGPIAAAVLWEASPYPSKLTFHGSFNLLSFTATLFPGGSEGSLAVTLGGPNCQVVSGVVAGPVVAAGTVIVVAATFASSAFHRFAAVNNKSASMLPVVGGQGCGISSPAEKCESEKSEREMRKKSLEELDQFDDFPPAVQVVFIDDDASEEKTGPDGGGEEVDGNMLPVVGGEEECGKSSAAEKCESEKSDRELHKKSLEEIDKFLDFPSAVEIIFIDDDASEEKTEPDGGGEEVDGNMLPVSGGEEECGKSSAVEMREEEKSDRGMLKKSLVDLDQFLDLPAAVEGDFIGDGASEEDTGLNDGGQEVEGNMFEIFLKELEQSLEVPEDVGGASNCVDGGEENRTAGLDEDNGREDEGNCFHEQYLDLEMVVEDSFGGSRDGCGEYLDLDAFSDFGACLPLY